MIAPADATWQDLYFAVPVTCCKEALASMISKMENGTGVNNMESITNNPCLSMFSSDATVLSLDRMLYSRSVSYTHLDVYKRQLYIPSGLYYKP